MKNAKKLNLLQMKEYLRDLEYCFKDADINAIIKYARHEGFEYTDLGFEEVSDRPLDAK